MTVTSLTGGEREKRSQRTCAGEQGIVWFLFTRAWKRGRTGLLQLGTVRGQFKTRVDRAHRRGSQTGASRTEQQGLGGEQLPWESVRTRAVGTTHTPQPLPGRCGSACPSAPAQRPQLGVLPAGTSPDASAPGGLCHSPRPQRAQRQGKGPQAPDGPCPSRAAGGDHLRSTSSPPPSVEKLSSTTQKGWVGRSRGSDTPAP